MSRVIARRAWRCACGDVLLVAALLVAVPGSILLYVGAGQAAALSALATAFALMVIGWVVGRG